MDVATQSRSFTTEQIGQTAGEVWHLLHAQGPQSVNQLVKRIDASRDIIMQALGWLAREDKIEFEEQGRRRLVYLR